MSNLSRLLKESWTLVEEDQDIIEDLLLNNEQSIEACNSNIKSIVNIREAYSSISSNNLNRTMKILTGATVLITPALSTRRSEPTVEMYTEPSEATASELGAFS